MKIEASVVPSAALIEYARIPIIFEVNAVLDADVRPDGDGLVLTERWIQTPYVKDYDALGEKPAEWTRRFDTSKWVIMIARIDNQCVGGVTVGLRHARAGSARWLTAAPVGGAVTTSAVRSDARGRRW